MRLLEKIAKAMYENHGREDVPRWEAITQESRDWMISNAQVARELCVQHLLYEGELEE